MATETTQRAGETDVARLWTEKEAASYLHVAPATLRKWRWSGNGPAFVKIGRCVRYDEISIRDYLATRVRRSTSDVGL